MVLAALCGVYNSFHSDDSPVGYMFSTLIFLLTQTHARFLENEDRLALLVYFVEAQFTIYSSLLSSNSSSIQAYTFMFEIKLYSHLLPVSLSKSVIPP